MKTTQTIPERAGSSLSLCRKAWNPYLVGAGIGILSWLVFLIVNKPIGMSTEVSKLSGWAASLFVGSFISAYFGKDLSSERLPSMWANHQGPSVGIQMVAAFFGGAILLKGSGWQVGAQRKCKPARRDATR